MALSTVRFLLEPFSEDCNRVLIPSLCCISAPRLEIGSDIRGLCTDNSAIQGNGLIVAAPIKGRICLVEQTTIRPPDDTGQTQQAAEYDGPLHHPPHTAK